MQQHPGRRGLSIRRHSSSFYLLSRGLQLHIGFFDWSLIVGALTLALFLPLTIGGLGVREGTLIGILGIYGYGSETAIAILTAFSSSSCSR